jgi:hypothetical protein
MQDGLLAPRKIGANEDITPKPGMERIADSADIDQSGLVLTGSTTKIGHT